MDRASASNATPPALTAADAAAVVAAVAADDGPFFAVDRDLRYLAFNEAHAAMVRDLTGGELTLGDRLAEHAPEKQGAALRELAARALAGERVATTVTVGSAERRTYETAWSPLRLPDGSIAGVVGTGHDVSAGRKAAERLAATEEQLRRVFETMEQGVVLQAADGRITSANPAAERILGLSLDQLQGRTSTDPRWRAMRADGSDFPGEEHPAMVALRSGSVVEGVQMGVYHPSDDSTRWILIDAVPLTRPSETEPHEVFTVFTDVTEYREAQRVLREAETARATSEERERIARELHDAVTQNIYSATLILDVLPATLGRSTSEAVLDVVTLRRLVRAALGELRTLLYELRPETLTATPLPLLVARLGDALAGPGDVAVTTVVTDGLALPGDVHVTFYRVAQEALNNVRKHARAARVHVSVEEDEDAVRLVVRDDGAGYDPAAAREGMGLGVMRERAAATGARLSVESRPGAGTTVRLAWRRDGEPAA